MMRASTNLCNMLPHLNREPTSTRQFWPIKTLREASTFFLRLVFVLRDFRELKMLETQKEKNTSSQAFQASLSWPVGGGGCERAT